MIDAIKAIPNYASLTPQQIADTLRATGITPRAIELGDLLFLLNNRGMLVRLIRPADGGEKWTGSLVNLINHCNDTANPLALHVNQFFSHITNDRNKTFDTRQVDYAGLFLLIATTFAGQPTMPTMADFAAVADLGGGWIYADATAESVGIALDKILKDNIRQATIGPLQSKLNAISTWLTTESALAMSVEDYQAYADSLLASADGNPVGGE